MFHQAMLQPHAQQCQTILGLSTVLQPARAPGCTASVRAESGCQKPFGQRPLHDPTRDRAAVWLLGNAVGTPARFPCLLGASSIEL